MNDHLGYSDYEALIHRARMERSVAVGNAIASVIAAIVSGLRRGIDALKSATGGSNASADPDAGAARDVPAHRQFR
jgi:hypothetical protein